MKQKILFLIVTLCTLHTSYSQTLYSVTYEGGSFDGGTINKYVTAANTLTVLKSFEINSATTGSNPIGSLVQAFNKKLYGTNENGGSNAAGVIFSYDLSSSTFTKLKDFNTSDGVSPKGSLIQGGNGKLYGMTTGGGAANAGVIFSTIRQQPAILNFSILMAALEQTQEVH